MVIEEKYIIYALCEPDTGAVRYVGMSSHGLIRPRSHYKDSNIKRYGHLPVYRWVKTLKEKDLIFGIKTLQVLKDKKTLESAEILWIKIFKDLGARLLNLTDGGVGQSKGYKTSEETKQKISEANKGRPGKSTLLSSALKILFATAGPR